MSPKPGNVTNACTGGAGIAGSAQRVRASLLVMLVAIALCYLVTLRAGQAWADDFALYVLHARNLVEGRPYAETGFIYNSLAPHHSPQAYPPGFPVLLAPVYALFGLNFLALRMVVIGSVVAAVAAFAALIRPHLPPRLVLPVAAAFGLQPYLLRFKNLLLPDFSFVLFVLLTLLLLRGLYENPTGEPKRGRALLAGACLYFSIALRTAGVALFGALFLFHVLRRKRPSASIFIVVATALALYGVQRLLIPSGSGYLAQIADIGTSTITQPVDFSDAAAPAETSPVDRIPSEVMRVLRAPARFFLSMDLFWTASGELMGPHLHGFNKWVVGLLMIVSVLLAFTGFVAQLRRPTIMETFVLAYAAVILLWPFLSARYLIPLIPFMFLYGALALVSLAKRGRRAGRIAAIAITTLVAASYLVNLPRIPRTAYANGVTGKQAQALFDYVRNCTPPSARFLTDRPRALALFTRREATAPPRPMIADRAHFAGMLDLMRIDYVMAIRNSSLENAILAQPGVTRTFATASRVVYRRPSAPSATCTVRIPR